MTVTNRTRAALVCASGVACICTLLSLIVPLNARPLNDDECSKLAEEHQQLIRQGVRENVARGAEWGMKHLDAQQINLVEKYLGLEEQMRFRCEIEARKVNAKRKLPAIVPLPARNTLRIKTDQIEKKGELPVGAAPERSDAEPIGADQTKRQTIDYHNQEHPKNASVGGMLIKTKPKWVQDVFGD